MWKFNHTDDLQFDSNHLYHSADEMYHYGVLGMKWGIRRAQRKGVEYAYKSHGQRKYDKKVAKLESKAQARTAKGKTLSKSTIKKIDKAKAKLSMYSARDKSRQEYAAKTNTGKALAKQVLLGPIGSGGYSRLRSAGYGRVVSTLGSGLPLTSKLLENNAAKNRAKGNR